STSAAPQAPTPNAPAPATAAPPANSGLTPTAGTSPNNLQPNEQPVSLQLPIERHQLSNGLRVVLNHDSSSPTAAVCITYDVGSRNEQRGRSGFAHLF